MGTGWQQHLSTFLYSTYKEPNPEVKGSQLKAKVRACVYPSALLRVPLMFVLLGHFPVPSHCLHIQNTHGMAVPNRAWRPFGREADRSASPFDLSCMSIFLFFFESVLLSEFSKTKLL